MQQSRIPSVRKNISISVVAIVALTMFSQLAIFAQEVLVTKFFSPTKAGTWGLVYGIVLFSKAFTDGATASDYLVVEDHNQIKQSGHSVFIFSVLQSFVIAIGIVVAGYALKWYLNEPIFLPLSTMIAGATLIEGFKNVGLAYSYIRMKPHVNVLINRGTQIVSVVATLAVFYVSRSMYVLIIGVIVHRMMLLTASYMYMPLIPNLAKVETSRIKKVAKFSLKLTLSVFLVFILRQGGRFIVGVVSTVEAVAFFSLAYILTNFAANIISFVANRILFPIFAAKCHQPANLQQAVGKAQVLLVSLSGLLFIVLYYPLRIIVNLFWGDEWAPVQNLLLPLSIYSALRVSVSLYPPLYKACDLQSKFNLIQFVQVAFVIFVVLPLSLYGGVNTYTWAILGEIVIQLLLSYAMFPFRLWNSTNIIHIFIVFVGAGMSLLMFRYTSVRFSTSFPPFIEGITSELTVVGVTLILCVLFYLVLHASFFHNDLRSMVSSVRSSIKN